jgi:hypothetical protein
MVAADKIKRYDSFLVNLVEVTTWGWLVALLIEQLRPGFFAGYINFLWAFIVYVILIVVALVINASGRASTPWLAILTLIAIILTTPASWPTMIIMAAIVGLVSLLI